MKITPPFCLAKFSTGRGSKSVHPHCTFPFKISMTHKSAFPETFPCLFCDVTVPLLYYLPLTLKMYLTEYSFS